ncbi:MAG TPA: FeoC-like transcriptional regulator [Chromatiaceae bacterium]|jgi:hypothetical protein|nr:FeoC-like transcriptional regulator [Chromatiaceae bacterium]
MTLIELKNFLLDHRQATLGEIAAHFSADRELVRGMLEVWQRKGKVSYTLAAKCQGCSQCGTAPIEVYQWQG